MNDFQAYKILGIHPGMTQMEMKTHHRRLNQELHPDRDAGDRDTFIEVQQAWKLVGTPEGRQTLAVRLSGLGTPCPDCGGNGFRAKSKSFLVVSTTACATCDHCGFIPRKPRNK